MNLENNKIFTGCHVIVHKKHFAYGTIFSSTEDNTPILPIPEIASPNDP